MSNKLLTVVLACLAISQVACSDKEKSAAVKYCQDNSEDCVTKYYQLAGASAAEGENQVAKTSAGLVDPTTGQVPSTEILPASVTSTVTADQIKKIAAENAEKLKAYEGDTSTGSITSGIKTSSASSIKPSSVPSGDDKVEIGVTRLFDDEPETSDAARKPSSVEPEIQPASADLFESGATR